MKTLRQKYYLPFKLAVKNSVIYFFGNRHYKKIVIIGGQRTGSSLLLWQLRTHPQIELEGEIFRLLKGRSCSEVWDTYFGKKLPWLKYAGFKIFYYHPEDSRDNSVWKRIEEDKSIRIIHITRHNLLRTYVSKLIAEKTGAWNSNQEKGQTGPGDKRVTIDASDCLQVFRQTKKWEEDFGTKKFKEHPYFALTYEQLTGDLQSQMNRILDFLDVSSITVKTNLKKQNPEPLKDLILNYDEIVVKLQDSEFGYLLEAESVQDTV